MIYMPAAGRFPPCTPPLPPPRPVRGVRIRLGSRETDANTMGKGVGKGRSSCLVHCALRLRGPLWQQSPRRSEPLGHRPHGLHRLVPFQPGQAAGATAWQAGIGLGCMCGLCRPRWPAFTHGRSGDLAKPCCDRDHNSSWPCVKVRTRSALHPAGRTDGPTRNPRRPGASSNNGADSNRHRPAGRGRHPPPLNASGLPITTHCAAGAGAA